MANQIAQTIIAQIGGMNRVAAMTGAKNFVSFDNGVRFDLPRGLKLEISLNGSDLYDAKLTKFNSRTFDTVVKKSVTDVFASDLVSALERMTGLHFSL